MLRSFTVAYFSRQILCKQRSNLLASSPTVASRHIRSFHSSLFRLAISPFKLHDIGEGIVEVEIIKWYVEDGQSVEEFDPLCEVQSDKSVVELTSHTTGKVEGIRAQAGDTVKVGQVLCDIQTDELEISNESIVITQETEEEGRHTINSEVVCKPENEDGRSMTTSKDDSKTVPEDPKQDQDVDSSSLFEIKDKSMDQSGPSRLTGEAAILPSPPSTSILGQLSDSTIQPPRRERERSHNQKTKTIIKASPAVRTLASRLAVDLNSVNGTGEGGRVLKEDVEAIANSTSNGRKMTTIPRPESEVVEFGRTRKVMFRALGEQSSIPHFGYSHTLNLTLLLPYLKSTNSQSSSFKQRPSYTAADIPHHLINDPSVPHDKKTTLLSFLIKGLIIAMDEHPIMRAKVKEAEGDRWLEISREGVIGVAVSDPKYGLLTPSLPALPSTTLLSTITSHLATLRSNPTRPGPSANLTISSIGSLGESTAAMPVLPPGGGLAICAVGRAKWEIEYIARDGMKDRKVWEMHSDEVEKMGTKAVLRVPVGWSADHRVLEGAELIAFTESWKKYIEEPWRWLKIDG